MIARAGVVAGLIVALGACTTDVPPSLPTVEALEVAARAAHSATVLADGTVLVVGGCVIDGCGSASPETFAITSDDAVEVGSLHDARDAHTATLLGSGHVLVTGGFTEEGVPPLASAEVFDPASATWTTVEPLATGRGGHAAALLGSGDVIVAGGWLRSRTYTATTEVYDPDSQSFTAGPELPVAADGLEAVTLSDGRVLVTGGQVAPGVASDQAVVVSADGTELETVGPLGTARFKHTMIALADGRVLIIGGTSDDTVLLTSTELFDPVTGSLSPGPELNHGRYKLAGGAALLPDGRVIVGGGGQGVEVIDVDAGVSIDATVASGVSSFGTASVSGETLFLIGGYDERIELTRRYLALPLAGLA